MLRTQAIRAISRSTRRYSTEPPLPGTAPPKVSSGNTALYTTAGIALAGGVYYYYALYEHPEAVQKLKNKSVAEEDEVVRKARELADAGKHKVDAAMASAQGKYDEARAKAEGVAGDARAKYDEELAAAKRSLSDARVSTENLYRDARGQAERKYGEAAGATEQKADEAKSGYFSWLGWGKSRGEEAKSTAAGKVAEGAEDVKKKAEKHT